MKRSWIGFILLLALLLGCILGVVIHFTGQSMEMQSISMMRTIATAPFQQGIPGKPMNEEVRLPFFTVQISSRGELITAGGGYFDLTDRELLQQIVDFVLSADLESGIASGNGCGLRQGYGKLPCDCGTGSRHEHPPGSSVRQKL